MAKRGVLWESVERATLKGYKLTFDKTSGLAGFGFATLRKSKNDIVEGLLYKCESKADALTLDLYENAPIQYKRIEMQVATAKGKKNAFLYIATSFYKQKGLKPTSEYLDHLLEGKKYLSKEYFKLLQDFTPEVQPLRVFVYGTLKKGFGNHSYYCEGAKIQSAMIKGKLYQSGSLPYASIQYEDFECIASKKNEKDFAMQEDLQCEVENGFLFNSFRDSECIKGELITFDNWEMISKLDSLEGFFSSDESSLNHYTRILTTCKTKTEEYSCWVYNVGSKNTLDGAELLSDGTFKGYAYKEEFTSSGQSPSDYLDDSVYYASLEAEQNRDIPFSESEEFEKDEFDSFNNPQY
jgi:gamma-glutamylcyclotransferase (GGCT)/AIG2-like uncharacterized protein YtfP